MIFMAYTLDDFIKLNPNYSKRYDSSTKTAYVKNNTTGKEIGFQSGQGKEYGMGGIQTSPGQVNGSNIVSDPNKLISSLGTTEYKSPYSEEISSSVAALKNRGPFSYNPHTDVGLQHAQDNAVDTVSRSAARKGMLYSDSNKASMNQAALDLVPQFEQSAFNKYQAEGTDMYNKLSALDNLENNAYNRFNADRTYAAGQDAAKQSQSNWDKTYGESKRQFDVGQQNWDKSFGESKRQFDIGQQNWQKEMTFKEREAQIQDALNMGQLSVSQAQLALSKAKFDSDNDPNSLDNQIKKAQLNEANSWNDPSTIENKLKQQQYDLNLYTKSNAAMNDTIQRLDSIYTVKDPITGAISINPNFTQGQMKAAIIGLNLSDDQTDGLLLRYGIPTN
jgi:hypothetical protein